MKKIILLLAVLFSLNAVAQNNILKIFIGSPQNLGLSFEHVLSEKRSYDFGLYIFDNDYNEKNTQAGWGAQLGYRYYLLNSGAAPKGLYLHPLFDFSSIAIRNKETYDLSKGLSYALNLTVGYQLVTKIGITGELYGGFGYGKRYIVQGLGKYDTFYLYPMVGISLGYAF